MSSNQGNGGVFINNSVREHISYSSFYDNEGGDFIGDPPDSMGLISYINANNDSCDPYFNIYFDPEFVNPANSNYRLTSTSPCIDAGLSDNTYDPDGTIRDIGAFFYDQNNFVPEKPISNPSEFEIVSIYPNPFNSTTEILMDLPSQTWLTLSVYNILGQKVALLWDNSMSTGRHRIQFDASGYSSGTYLIHATINKNTMVARSIHLIK